MGGRKDAERQRAIELRREGFTLRAIAKELGVALASASVWTSGVEVPSAATTTPIFQPIEAGPEIWCRVCCRFLPQAAFSPTGAREGRCRPCLRNYFQQRGDLHRRQSAAARERRRREAKAFVGELLARSRCADCDLANPLVLEFDHVGPKRAHVSTLIHEGYSIRRLRDEIRHCDIVCVNCHRRRTARRAFSWRLSPHDLRMDGYPGRERNLRYVLSILERSACVDCGEDDLVVLEFDHVGEKEGSVINMACAERPLEAVKREIAKCETRCANCHRHRTIEAGGGFRNHLRKPP